LDLSAFKSTRKLIEHSHSTTARHMKITVYSKSVCPQCESAKSLLKSRSLPFEEIKVDDEAERLAFYAKCGPSVRQMPQIFINDQRVGGLSGLQAALAQMAGT
jgi:glutaredoxin 3